MKAALATVALAASGLLGIIVGAVATVGVFALAAVMRHAYPPWAHGAPALCEITGLAAVAAFILGTPPRHLPASLAARVFTAAGVLMIVFLVAGELGGFLHLEGPHPPLYLKPA